MEEPRYGKARGRRLRNKDTKMRHLPEAEHFYRPHFELAEVPEETFPCTNTKVGPMCSQANHMPFSQHSNDGMSKSPFASHLHLKEEFKHVIK
jgi:hypothetical protein